LDSERARSSNLEQALKHERLNVDSRERELEKKSQLLQELSNREQETINDLEEEVVLGKIVHLIVQPAYRACFYDPG
jgi:hypothetical protein